MRTSALIIVGIMIGLCAGIFLAQIAQGGFIEVGGLIGNFFIKIWWGIEYSVNAVISFIVDRIIGPFTHWIAGNFGKAFPDNNPFIEKAPNSTPS